MTGAALLAAGNVGRVMEHSDDHGSGLGVVGHPTPARSDPGPAGSCEVWVRPGHGKPGGGMDGDGLPGLFERGHEGARRLRARAVFAMLAELAHLPRGPGA